jgi:cytochrome c
MGIRLTHLLLAGCAFQIAIVAPGHAQNASNGGTLFKQRCSMCHVTDPAKKSTMGPNLAGVAGRKVAGRTDFNYSPAMKKGTGTWTVKSLDTFLAGPTKMFPGARMPIAVPAAKDRADIVAYLAMLRSK